MWKEGNYQNIVLIQLIHNAVLTCPFNFVEGIASLYVKHMNDDFFRRILYGWWTDERAEQMTCKKIMQRNAAKHHCEADEITPKGLVKRPV